MARFPPRGAPGAREGLAPSPAARLRQGAKGGTGHVPAVPASQGRAGAGLPFARPEPRAHGIPVRGPAIDSQTSGPSPGKRARASGHLRLHRSRSSVEQPFAPEHQAPGWVLDTPISPKPPGKRTARRSDRQHLGTGPGSAAPRPRSSRPCAPPGSPPGSRGWTGYRGTSADSADSGRPSPCTSRYRAGPGVEASVEAESAVGEEEVARHSPAKGRQLPQALLHVGRPVRWNCGRPPSRSISSTRAGTLDLHQGGGRRGSGGGFRRRRGSSAVAQRIWPGRPRRPADRRRRRRQPRSAPVSRTVRIRSCRFSGRTPDPDDVSGRWVRPHRG